MPSSKTNREHDDFFSKPKIEEQQINNRIAIRYIRADIKANLSFLVFFRFKKTIPVKLLDISSKGAAVECKQNFSVNKKIELDLFFEDTESFAISARIIHKNNDQYGLQFDHFNNELGDHLLESQNDLVFK